MIRLNVPTTLFAVSWWRLFKTIALLGTLAAVLTAAAPLAARRPPFRLEVKPFHRVVDKAKRELTELAPNEVKRLQPLIDEADRLTLAERIGGTSYAGRPAGDAWCDVFRTSHGALVAAKRKRDDFKTRWETLRAQADKAVVVAEHQVERTPGMNRSASRSLEKAQSQLRMGHALAAKGRFEQAVEAARTSLEAIKTVNARWETIHDRFEEPSLRRLWRSWADAAVADSHSRTSILIDKLERRLEVLRNGKPIATFHCELGTRGLDRKLHAGDKATPEGRYKVVAVKGQGFSKYYKALLINYPNAEDISRYRNAKRNGAVPGRAGVGNLIEIHGHGGQGKDWTEGCIALRDHEMDKLFKLVGNGTPVTIVGTVPERRGS